MPKTTPTVEPPAAAVAKDPHWAATRQRLRARQRPAARLTICDDDTVKQALADARRRHDRAAQHAEANPDDQVLAAALAGAEDKLAAAQAAFDETAIVLRFQALPRIEFEEMKAAHPPTETQAEDGAFVNVESLGPVLIAAASLDGITEDEARDYLATWSEGEATQLFQAAWDIQSTIRADLGKG
ncbi:hypothetical protein [Streptomyces sp. NPDC006551]|uniref:hypothetical protein n=1 Tax=Streptomyces sp. NPDC006551 TaxID=3157178 RepID=UPI0033B24D2A